MLEDIEGHGIYTENNGWLVNNEQELAAVLAEINSGGADLRAMAAESEKLARKKLDYAVLARRILD